MTHLSAKIPFITLAQSTGSVALTQAPMINAVVKLISPGRQTMTRRLAINHPKLITGPIMIRMVDQFFHFKRYLEGSVDAAKRTCTPMTSLQNHKRVLRDDAPSTPSSHSSEMKFRKLNPLEPRMMPKKVERRG